MKALVVLAAILSLAPQAHAQTPIPVGAFVQNPANATTHKAMGINTYWNLWRVNRPLATQLQQIAAAGMFVIAEDSGPDGLFLSSFKTSHAAQIKGYLIPDEPDAMVHAGACLPFATITSTIAAITSRDATRPIGVNYSPGMNYQLTHRRCNRMRGTMAVDDFRKIMQPSALGGLLICPGDLRRSLYLMAI